MPFFQNVSFTYSENESGQAFPVLTDLAENIIEEVYNNGRLGYGSREEARVIADSFVTSLGDSQKECLAFYFCTQNDLIDEWEDDLREVERIDEDFIDKEIGLYITRTIKSMRSSADGLADKIVDELIHLQDIFSTQDIGHWDASSISDANENFVDYLGLHVSLIPLPIDDLEYWEKAMGGSGEEE